MGRRLSGFGLIVALAALVTALAVAARADDAAAAKREAEAQLLQQLRDQRAGKQRSTPIGRSHASAAWTNTLIGLMCCRWRRSRRRRWRISTR